MATIREFSAQMKKFYDRQDAAFVALQNDMKTLTDQIKAFNNSPGTLSSEDQASLDAIQVRAEGFANALDALDALTPPAAPPA